MCTEGGREGAREEIYQFYLRFAQEITTRGGEWVSQSPLLLTTGNAQVSRVSRTSIVFQCFLNLHFKSLKNIYCVSLFCDLMHRKHWKIIEMLEIWSPWRGVGHQRLQMSRNSRICIVFLCFLNQHLKNLKKLFCFQCFATWCIGNHENQ